LSYSLKKLLLFEIQNAKHAKAIRLKGEGSKPGEWKNKNWPKACDGHFCSLNFRHLT
jgi:hypothetical protein